MVLTASGAISLNDIRTEYGITGAVSMDMLYGWSGVTASGAIGINAFYGKTFTNNEYPPTTIGAGSTWTKDGADLFTGFDGTYRKYKYTIGTGGYGQGLYVAYANSILLYLNGTTYNTDEWPPSGPFDKITAYTNSRSGWHVGSGSYTSGADATTPPIIYLQLPFPIAVVSYSLQCRSDCCNTQPPSKWNLEASNDGSSWTVLNSQSGITSWALSETKSYNISNRSKYSYYRIVVYRNSSSTANNIHISEIRFYAPEYRN